MVKIELFFAMTVALLLAVCNEVPIQNIALEETGVKKESTWQEQVKCARKETLAKSSNGITLIGFTYRGKIRNQEQILELHKLLFADTVDVVVNTGGNYAVASVKSVRDMCRNINYDPFKHLELQLDTMITLGVDVIDLEWSYKGRTVYSTAIASNEKGGILYDHIGNKIVTSKRQPRKKKTVSNKDLLKTKSEEGDSNREVITEMSDNGGYNLWGKLVWEYYIFCRSVFDSEGILCDRFTHTRKHAEGGWSCDAKIQSIGGEVNVSKYHEFAWAYAYGENITVSISWDGSGFTNTSGGSASSGTLVHRRK